MKKSMAILFVVGLLLASVGIVQANTLSINANVSSAISLALDPATLTFNGVQQGTPSASQPLTATTTGSGNYQLQLSSTTFTAAGGITQPTTVLQYKETAAVPYVNATATATNMLAAPGTAVVAPGDAKTFDFRVNFPANAVNGAYAATVTITAAPL
ncbi:MAG: hypothetical protein VR69_00390 [Peptococcaceae bacterium BRH_c4b]|nr:MAG: hypothetical protein VR69_00390 [Peptococcaceae bacterium BRH_c4b]